MSVQPSSLSPAGAVRGALVCGGSVAEPPPVPISPAVLYVAVVAFGRHLHGAGECSGLAGFGKS